MDFDYEVLIVGGGPAGLTAAMTLGRMSRTALVCDDGHPRNAPSSHVNNFPSQDGIHPQEWLKQTRQNLEKYKTIDMHSGTVSSIRKIENGFIAELGAERAVKIRKVILAYGVKDIPLPVPGFKELWGKSIFHCPFCHGFEVRGSKLGLIATSELSFHSLPMIFDLASDLIVFTNGKSQFTSEQRDIMKRKKIELYEGKIQRFLYEVEKAQGVVLEDGQSIERQAFFYSPPIPMTLKSDLGKHLGCEVNSFGFYKINERGSTTTPGVFACGDISSLAHSVLLASASGVMAGAGAVAELLSENLLMAPSEN